MPQPRTQPPPLHRLAALLASDPDRWFTLDELAKLIKARPAKHVQVLAYCGVAEVSDYEKVRWSSNPDPDSLRVIGNVLAEYGVELTPKRRHLRLVV